MLLMLLLMQQIQLWKLKVVIYKIFLTDASYLSLQNINLGYTLPSRICRTMGMEKLRIYMACDNVWVWSKRQGLDPRQSITGSVTSAYYAPMRTISGGITLTF